MRYTNTCSMEISVAAVYSNGSGSGLQYVPPGRTILTGNTRTDARQNGGNVRTAVCPSDYSIVGDGVGDAWKGGDYRCRAIAGDVPNAVEG